MICIGRQLYGTSLWVISKTKRLGVNMRGKIDHVPHSLRIELVLNVDIIFDQGLSSQNIRIVYIYTSGWRR